MTEVIEIEDVILSANLQSTGPAFIADALSKVDQGAGMLLSARLIITAGIADTNVPFRRVYGPLPIPEYADGYACFFYVEEMKQQPIAGQQFSTGKGTYIYSIIIPDSKSSDIVQYIPAMEEILHSKSGRIPFEKAVSGMIPPEITDTANVVLTEIYDEIKLMLKYRAEYGGGSLFNFGLLNALPDNVSKIAKKIMQNPDGTQIDQIDDEDALNVLYLAGLVRKENKEGKIWIIPR